MRVSHSDDQIDMPTNAEVLRSEDGSVRDRRRRTRRLDLRRDMVSYIASQDLKIACRCL